MQTTNAALKAILESGPIGAAQVDRQFVDDPIVEDLRRRHFELHKGSRFVRLEGKPNHNAEVAR